MVYEKEHSESVRIKPQLRMRNIIGFLQMGRVFSEFTKHSLVWHKATHMEFPMSKEITIEMLVCIISLSNSGRRPSHFLSFIVAWHEAVYLENPVKGY